jgi:hypothetical protein
MTRTLRPLVKELNNTPGGLRGMPVEQRKQVLARAREVANLPRAKKGRPPIGQRGVSGPGGKWFKSWMIARLGQISQLPKNPNFGLAKKLNQVLFFSRRGQLQIEEKSVEHQALVDIMNNILLADKKFPSAKVELTQNQERVLEKLFSAIRGLE